MVYYSSSKKEFFSPLRGKFLFAKNAILSTQTGGISLKNDLVTLLFNLNLKLPLKSELKLNNDIYKGARFLARNTVILGAGMLQS